MDTPGVIQLIILFVLVLLSGFFSSAETALTTSNRVRMRTLEEEGDKRAARVNRILDNYSKMLSAILIGNNIVNIAASALATTLAIRVNFIVGIATGILTIIILLFGEIIPKTWAMFNADSIALFYSGAIYGLMRLLTPVIFLVDRISHAILLYILRIDPSKKTSTMTENELRTYVDVSHEDGVIESEERAMIYNVFDFSDSVARDIMIPRINMVTVSVDASYEKVLEEFRSSMYTRLPVYQDDKDNIIGLINIKDFILTTSHESFCVRDILREGYYTYERKKVADLLLEMRETTTNVAFVLSEYGDTVGMITLEDMLEEIVGEIRDEYDADEEEFIQETPDGGFLVEGTMKLDDINDALGTRLSSEDYDSIGGLMIDQLDRLPEELEEITLPEGIRLTAQEVDQNRVAKVLLRLPEGEAPEPEEPSGEGREHV